MHTLSGVVNNIIQKSLENQGAKRKKIDIDTFEQEVVRKVGTQEKYNQLGGYREFYKCINSLEESGVIIPLTSVKVCNSKKPVLKRFWWLAPKYYSNLWDLNTIANLSTVLDISFYVRNKKYQTDDELKKIMCLYNYFKNEKSNITIVREERSLSIFNFSTGTPN